MSCSCAIDRAAGETSSGGWHFRKAGDLGCFATGHSRFEGGVEVCNRGAGIHNCKRTGQECIYRVADVAFERCPAYAAAVERNISHNRLKTVAKASSRWGSNPIFEED